MSCFDTPPASASALFEKLAALASDVGASSADGPPTDQHREVHALLRAQLTQYRTQFDDLMAKDVAVFNAPVAALGAQAVTRVP